MDQLGSGGVTAIGDPARGEALNRRRASILGNPETNKLGDADIAARDRLAAVRSGAVTPDFGEQAFPGRAVADLGNHQATVDIANRAQEMQFQNALPQNLNTAVTGRAQAAGTFANTPEFQRGLQADISDRIEQETSDSDTRLEALNRRLADYPGAGTGETNYVQSDEFLNPPPVVTTAPTSAAMSNPNSDLGASLTNAQPASPAPTQGGDITKDQNSVTAPLSPSKQRKGALQRRKV